MPLISTLARVSSFTFSLTAVMQASTSSMTVLHSTAFTVTSPDNEHDDEEEEDDDEDDDEGAGTAGTELVRGTAGTGLVRSSRGRFLDEDNDDEDDGGTAGTGEVLSVRGRFPFNDDDDDDEEDAGTTMVRSERFLFFEVAAAGDVKADSWLPDCHRTTACPTEGGRTDDST
jgi:hypothetical protein